jgi:acetyl-CoA synthetase
MSSPRIHAASPEFVARAAITPADYERLYAESLRDPEAFWSGVAKRLDWMRFPTRIKDVSYRLEDFHIRWYADGELNVSVNCLDRHLDRRGDKTRPRSCGRATIRPSRAISPIVRCTVTSAASPTRCAASA